MFSHKSPCSLIQRTQLKSSSLRKFREYCLLIFPLLSLKDIWILLPNKGSLHVDRCSSPSQSASSDVFKFLVYWIEPNRPLFYDFTPFTTVKTHDFSSSFGDPQGTHFYPSLFTIWHCPQILPNIIIPAEVSTFLLHGQDLLLPGILKKQNENFDFQQILSPSSVPSSNHNNIGELNMDSKITQLENDILLILKQYNSLWTQLNENEKEIFANKNSENPQMENNNKNDDDKNNKNISNVPISVPVPVVVTENESKREREKKKREKEKEKGKNKNEISNSNEITETNHSSPSPSSSVPSKHFSILSELDNKLSFHHSQLAILRLFHWKKGEKRSVLVHSNPHTFCYGVMECSNIEAKFHNWKGKAMRIIHIYGDQLWKMGEESFKPNEGFHSQKIYSLGGGKRKEEKEGEGEQEEIMEKKGEHHNNNLNQIAISKEETQKNEEKNETSSTPSSSLLSTSSSSTTPDPSINSNSNNDNIANDNILDDDDEEDDDDDDVSSSARSSSSPSSPSRIPADQMDLALERSFLCALKFRVPLDVLPLRSSSLLSHYMEPSNVTEFPLNLKFSSHKKLSKFMQKMSTQFGSLVVIKSLKSCAKKCNEEFSLIKFDKDHTALKSLVVESNYQDKVKRKEKEKMKKDKERQEEMESKSGKDEKEEHPIGSAQRYPHLVVLNAYKPEKAIRQLFSSIKISFPLTSPPLPDDLYHAKDAKAIFWEYFRQKGLEKENQEESESHSNKKPPHKENQNINVHQNGKSSSPSPSAVKKEKPTHNNKLFVNEELLRTLWTPTEISALEQKIMMENQVLSNEDEEEEERVIDPEYMPEGWKSKVSSSPQPAPPPPRPSISTVLQRFQFSKSELSTRFDSHLVPYYHIVFDGNISPSSSSSSFPFLRGHAPNIEISVERRAGKKLVTKMFGLSVWGIDENLFVREIQKKYAASATVSEGEVIIQGNVTGDILLTIHTHYHIPKQYIHVTPWDKNKK